MSRKDTIIVAALINTGLLAVLFMMAIHTETIDRLKDVDTGNEVVESAPPPSPASLPLSEPRGRSEVALADVSNRDEFDQVLGRYAPTTPPPVVVAPVTSRQETPSRKPVSEPEEKYVEVTVKRGDYLEKIANANGTTVGAIMRANTMPSVRITVGQVLRIPLNDKKVVEEKSVPAMREQKNDVADSERHYYTMKSGDNPWKIARQFHVRFDELLKMNDLDEGKARSLKPGDILRVK